jgi:regulatory protein
MTKEEALNKAMKLCSVKEYAPFEIEQKLASWGLNENTVAEVISILREDKFIDEYRMARYFANDRLKFNKWGRIKIKYILQQKKLSPDAIAAAMNQINEQEYLKILTGELAKKRKTIKDSDEFTIRAKMFQFASGRGFEGDIIYKLLDKMI